MMFKRIDHVEIVTDQFGRTEQFYTEVLGFTVKARDRIDRSGLGVPIDLVNLDLGGTVVELIQYEGAAVEPAPLTEHLVVQIILLVPGSGGGSPPNCDIGGAVRGVRYLIRQRTFDLERACERIGPSLTRLGHRPPSPTATRL